MLGFGTILENPPTLGVLDPILGGRFTYPPTPLPPLDSPIFDESFKRHPTRLLRPLNGTPRQFWNVVPKSTAPGHHVPMRPRINFRNHSRGVSFKGDFTTLTGGPV